jgi:hypothetical protein
MAKVLERLELERPEIVAIGTLAEIAAEEGIATPAAVLAARMRERGWLLPTGQRGVWEFAPAEVAGPYSSMDPLLPLKAFSATHPDLKPALTMQAAAWALGFADRVPAIIDVAFPEAPAGVSLPEGLRAHTFAPALPVRESRGVDVLAPESLLVHMAASPTRVPSWQSAAEWLPDVACEMGADETLAELAGRRASVRARTGYLLQGMRPDIANAIMEGGAPTAKVRFGPRRPSVRNDERWKIADTVLPFDPEDMEASR